MANGSNVRENILKKGEYLDGIKIKGYDFNEGVYYSKIIDSFANTGFQASNLSKSIEIINEMVKVNSLTSLVIVELVLFSTSVKSNFPVCVPAYSLKSCANETDVLTRNNSKISLQIIVLNILFIFSG